MPAEWEGLTVIGPPRLDAVTVMAQGEPEQHGFRQEADGAWWKGPWRGYPKRDRWGAPWTRAIPPAEQCALFGGQQWEWCAEERVSRVDVKRDVTGAPVWLELVQWIAGARGERGADERQHKGNIIHAGARKSSVYLRIYEKDAEPEKVPAWLLDEWRRYGWRGAPVTRVEYEFKDDAVQGLTVQDLTDEKVMEMWCDGLKRLRLCRRRPELYTQKNKAPTCDGWKRLGEPQKRERGGTSTEPEDWQVRCVARLLRRLKAGGVDVDEAYRRVEEQKRAEKEAKTRAEIKRAIEQVWRLAQNDGEVLTD